jgi:hypothetical protein
MEILKNGTTELPNQGVGGTNTCPEDEALWKISLEVSTVYLENHEVSGAARQKLRKG